MNKSVIITADSTCDLSPELIERFGIKTIPLTIVLGEESYLDGSLSPDEIYARYREDGTLPKTSAVSMQSFIDFFSALTAEGYEVVHFDLSSELSTTFNNARLAALEVEGVYPVDSRMLSVGLGILAIEAAQCRDRGMSAAEIVEYVSSLADKVDTSFVLDNLEFLWKGGRCSGVAALGANLLKLRPAIEMNEGKLSVYKKYRGTMLSVYKQYIKERLNGKKIKAERLFIANSGEVEESVLKELETLVRELADVEEIHHVTAGCTVSSHCGPGTLGIIFINE